MKRTNNYKWSYRFPYHLLSAGITNKKIPPAQGTKRTLFLLLICFYFSSCSKLVSISDPVDMIVTNQAFSTNDLANAAMGGVYFTLLPPGTPGFANGLSSLYGALSSDEIVTLNTSGSNYLINANRISIMLNGTGSNVVVNAPTDDAWSSAYKVIYAANAVIEGIAASTSVQLTDSVRKQITAEAKGIRAFCYFYLTNFYGDVPLLLNTNYNANILVARSSQAEVYQQIIKDLKEAQTDLYPDYSFNNGNRTRMNKWAATALLARVYLYMQDYDNAVAEATAVINNTDLYNLEPDLNNVFLTGSHEAIWQLNQVVNAISTDATPDGSTFLPANQTLNTGPVAHTISPQLLNAFEENDMRRSEWVDSTTFIVTAEPASTFYFPYKYKIGGYNQITGATPIEYYIALRLAEQYLIRAEAEAHGSGNGTVAAIADLNIIRARAGLPGLPGNLSQPGLLAAVAREWQIEFFCEWGHRWFNLKRTGEAQNILSAIPLKQPWQGDSQLLYPIPIKEIQLDRNLTQNPGY